MNARSFFDVLRSDKNGQIDASRTWVISGRERHVAFANENNLPYPQRALRTREFLYIRNFAPERWPLGAPYRVTETSAPDQEELESETYAAFADMDAGPTKAWLALHRNDSQWKRYYEIAFAKRPAEELYDLSKDPYQQRNIAADPAYAKDRARLEARLMKILTEAGDPRVTGDGKTFERPPFTAPSPQEKQRRPR
jgi:N-sulfoglucosamine sulfohydrolase